MTETERFPADRLQRLAALWSWLPAFRAVAETEHLPSAAALLGVGPSALSRSIALLEQQVGRPLFTRAARTLSLNADGQLLRTALREAMRRVDDGLDDLDDDALRGTLHIASRGSCTTTLVAPALAVLCQRHPHLLPVFSTCAAADIPARLLRGQLDVAFLEDPVPTDGLTCSRVATIARGVYCGRTHPLFAQPLVTLADLHDAPFVALPADGGGCVPDGWPPELPRRIGLVTDQLRVGLEVCAAMPLLAVLPDALAASRRDALRRLPLDLVAPVPLLALHRRPLGNRGHPAGELTALVRQAAAAP